MYFSRTKYSHKEKYYDNDLTDSEDEGDCQSHGCGHPGPSRHRPRHNHPRYSRPLPAPGTELVVAPKAPAPASPCKYKCCPCHAEAAAAKACACHCPAKGAAHSACCPAKPPEKKPEERIVIEVVDRTGGPMAQTHGSRFPISIKPDATVGDIITMLTPDSHRHKVLVRWDDGFVEDLETVPKVGNLKFYARKLYIVNRKQVRYAPRLHDM